MFTIVSFAGYIKGWNTPARSKPTAGDKQERRGGSWWRKLFVVLDERDKALADDCTAEDIQYDRRD